MRHFLKLAQNLDVIPLLVALHRQPWLFDTDTTRTAFPGSPHALVSDILLRFSAVPEYVQAGGVPVTDDVHECLPLPAWWALPEAHPLVLTLFTAVRGTRLGRVMITRLDPGTCIPAHIDSKAQTDYYQRFHITLAAPPWACVFTIEDEQVEMKPGECFWINNAALHGVSNDGDCERISLIVDIHSDRAS